MEHLGSHWTDFLNEIWYLTIFKKSVEKIQVPFKSYENNVYSARSSMYIYHNISLSVHLILDKSCRVNENIYYKYFIVQLMHN